MDIATLDGGDSFSVYRADPEGTPVGAIVVIQEIFGVNEGIRRKVDFWASRGYLAAAPDLFWRSERGVELDADKQDEFQRGVALMQATDQDAAIRDIEATIRALRAELGHGGKVGAVGYCFGGRLAFMTATRTDADASVGYYGVNLDNLLEEAKAIGKPVLLHIAGADHFVPQDQQDRVRNGLAGNSHVTIHTYDGEDHGFATELGERRSEDAATLADGRTEAFFAEHLG